MRRWRRWVVAVGVVWAGSASASIGEAQATGGAASAPPAGPAPEAPAPVGPAPAAPEAAPPAAAEPAAPPAAPASEPVPAPPSPPASVPPPPSSAIPSSDVSPSAAPAEPDAPAAPASAESHLVTPQPSAAPAPPLWRYSPHASFVLPTDARRHIGFSLRVSVGLGLAWAERELRRGSAEISGPNAILNLDVGAAAIENLILYARLGGFAFDHAFSGDSENAGTAFFGTFGAGARYHFMPLDFYASGTLALAAVSVTDDLGEAQNAGPGFGFEIEAGKNWWAGSYRERWCVGLGLRFAYMRSGSVDPRRGERGEDPWIGTTLSLVFSTAYN